MGSTLSTRVFTRLSVGRFQKSVLFVGLYREMSTENLFSASVPSRVRNMSQHTKTGNKKGATHWTRSTSIYEFENGIPPVVSKTLMLEEGLLCCKTLGAIFTRMGKLHA